MVEVLQKYDKELFEPLLALLAKKKLPVHKGRCNRRGFPEGQRSAALGVVRGRFNGVVGLSYFSKRNPLLYNEIMRIGKIISPFPFRTIHLNSNITCPKHKDSKNTGKSLLISFGDYTGGNIMVEGTMYDAKYTPVIFNGSELEHWNTDDLVGTKYSLVLYNHGETHDIE